MAKACNNAVFAVFFLCKNAVFCIYIKWCIFPTQLPPPPSTTNTQMLTHTHNMWMHTPHTHAQTHTAHAQTLR